MWNHINVKVMELENDYSLVKFSSEVEFHHVVLDGPWTIFGNYLIVCPWSPEFYIATAEINSFTVWVRLPRLPLHFYHKKVLRGIGEAIGKVDKIDYNTGDAINGRFARLAVSINLKDPLVSQFSINGRV